MARINPGRRIITCFQRIWSNSATRFVVLTHDSLHWFVKKDESHEFFGEERGHIELTVILSVRVMDEDGTTFEIIDTTHTHNKGSSKPRMFRYLNKTFRVGFFNPFFSVLVIFDLTTKQSKHASCL